MENSSVESNPSSAWPSCDLQLRGQACPGLPPSPLGVTRSGWGWQSPEEPGRCLLRAPDLPQSATTGTPAATGYLGSVDVQTKLNGGRGI